MVNLTGPNSYPPGRRAWSVAFVGTAGDLPLMMVDDAGLLPSGGLSAAAVNHPGQVNTTINRAAWPPDAARIVVSEVQRGETVAAAQRAGSGEGLASGTAGISFDADVDGTISPNETVTVDVGANASVLQEALRSIGGLLGDVEVSVDRSAQRARNGGERAWASSQSRPGIFVVSWGAITPVNIGHCRSSLDLTAPQCCSSTLWGLPGAHA